MTIEAKMEARSESADVAIRLVTKLRELNSQHELLGLVDDNLMFTDAYHRRYLSQERYDWYKKTIRSHGSLAVMPEERQCLLLYISELKDAVAEESIK